MKKEIISLKASIQEVNGKMTIVASDETVDRSGEVVRARQWDLSNFLKSPRLLVDHDYSVKSIVGKAVNARVENAKLLFEPLYHDITELARQVKEMVDQGFLDTVSVGFIRKGEGNNVVNELLEISFVAVPANPNARVLAVKDIGADDERAIKEFIDDENFDDEDEIIEEAEQEDDEVEEKGVIDDTLNEAKNKRNDKNKLFDPIYYRFWDFCDAYMNANVEPERLKEFWDDFVAGVNSILASGERTNKTIKAIPMEYIQAQGLEVKSGKVLSGKNKEKVSGAIESMKQATGALQSVLDASEGSDESKSQKQRSSGAGSDVEAMEQFLLLKKALRAVNTATSEALAKSKTLNK